MRGGEQVLAALGALDERAQASVHGWVLDADVLSMKQQVRGLADRGLVEIAGKEDRAELSAWEGTLVLWVVRLSPAGHDLLLYARSRPPPRQRRGRAGCGTAPGEVAALADGGAASVPGPGRPVTGAGGGRAGGAGAYGPL